MEAVRPVRVFFLEPFERRVSGAPFAHVFFGGTPAEIGQIGGLVVLHDVYFPAHGPLFLDAQGPESRPHAFPRGESGPDFKPPVQPGKFAARRQGGRGVFRLFPCRLPVFSLRIVMGVGMFFLPAFNNQHAVFAIGVFRLVPLRFLALPFHPSPYGKHGSCPPSPRVFPGAI